MTVLLADPAEVVTAHDGGTPCRCGVARSPVGVLLSMVICWYHLRGLSLLSSGGREALEEHAARGLSLRHQVSFANELFAIDYHSHFTKAN